MNELLKQFMDSSIAVSEQIALMAQENQRLKKRVSELEELKQSEPEPEPDAHICDLMPIGETFCGLEVVMHDREKAAIKFKARDGDTAWLFGLIAKSIYDAEIELRELRMMEPMADAFWVWLGEKTDEALKPVCDAFWKYKLKGIKNAEQ